MGATKNFYSDCAEARLCPVSDETWKYLDSLEQSDSTIDWIGYSEHEYIGHDGRLYMHDCIEIDSARRLLAESLANDEIAEFLECFGEFCID